MDVQNTVIAPAVTTNADPKTATAVAPAAEPPKLAPKPEDDLAHRFASLTRKERGILDRERKLSEREKKLIEIEAREELASKDPLAYLEKRGLTLDQILKKAAGEDDTPEAKIDSKLSVIEQKIADYEKKEAEKEAGRVQGEHQKAVAAFRDNIKLEVGKEAEKFEAIIETDSYDLVFDLCQRYYEEHSEIPPIEWAAQEVEKELTEQARKFAALKKLAKTNASDAVVTPNETDPQSQEKPAPTINSKMTPEPTVPQKRRLTDEESLREAAKLIKWT